jgi:Flp pilus assembly protein CpaB
METGRLDPTVVDRVRGWLRPGPMVVLRVRRGCATVLAGLAAVLMVRGDPDRAVVPVVVASRDLEPGRALVSDDLQTVRRPAGELPDGAVRDPARLTGRVLAGPMRAGEIVTDVRVLDSRMAAAATGGVNVRIVPIRPADPGLDEIVRPGDRVDVVAVARRSPDEPDRADTPTAPTVAARDAVVVSVSAATSRSNPQHVVLVAVDEPSAASLAALSLTSALTLVLR